MLQCQHPEEYSIYTFVGNKNKVYNTTKLENDLIDLNIPKENQNINMQI